MSQLRKIASLALGASLLVFGGCAAPSNCCGECGEIVTESDATAEDLRARLNVAKAISMISTRDDACAAIAMEASANGASDVCVAALENIMSISTRDRTAAKASGAAARSGDIAAARRLAEMISSISTRDEALRNIATGSGGN